MHPLHVIADIQYYTGKYVKYKREAYRQKRGINKKQPDLIYRDVKLFAKISAHPK
jgi:hypothetical protein